MPAPDGFDRLSFGAANGRSQAHGSASHGIEDQQRIRNPPSSARLDCSLVRMAVGTSASVRHGPHFPEKKNEWRRLICSPGSNAAATERQFPAFLLRSAINADVAWQMQVMILRRSAVHCRQTMEKRTLAVAAADAAVMPNPAG